jgi:hypothetical protein
MDIVRHVIKRIVNPQFLSKMTSYDVVSTIHESLQCAGSYCCSQAAADLSNCTLCESGSGRCLAQNSSGPPPYYYYNTSAPPPYYFNYTFPVPPPYYYTSPPPMNTSALRPPR